MRVYEHLTFTELEIHIEAAQHQLNGKNIDPDLSMEKAAEKSAIRQRINDLQEELDLRREHLLK